MKMRLFISGYLIFLLSSSLFASDVRMRGFASIVGGQTLSSDETLYGYESDLAFTNDSLAAIQFSSDMGEGLSATVQMVARGENNFEVDVEWAYLTYEFNDSVQLSAGRIRMPFYRYSDFLDVRYTYSWVKAPQSVYGFELPGYDGLSLLINSTFGSWDSTFQAIYGQMDDTVFGPGIVRLSELFGFNWVMARDWLTLRAAYLPMHVTNDSPGFTGMAQLSLDLGQSEMVDTSELAEYILLNDDPGYFGGVAVGIDYNDWLVDFEYISYGSDGVSAQTEAYYLSFAKRIGKVTPFITVSHQENEANNDTFNLIPDELSAGSQAIIRGALEGFYAATQTDTDLLLGGVRYDFHSSAALKAEYATQDDISGSTNSVVRISVDLIF